MTIEASFTRPPWNLSFAPSALAPNGPVGCRAGLQSCSLLAPDLPVQVISCGVPFLVVPLATRAAVDRAVADRGVLGRVCAAQGQGMKMQRPSRIHIAIGSEGDEITDVRVGGQAVLIGRGTLEW